MTQAVFDQTMARVVELGKVNPRGFQQELKISLCGLGEPLLNPKTPGFVRQIRERGFECVMSSNAALLDERRGEALLDAGLQQININVGDRDEDYEQVYKLPFHKTRDNVLRFAEIARGRCEVHIVLVDFRRDREHIEKMVQLLARPRARKLRVLRHHEPRRRALRRPHAVRGSTRSSPRRRGCSSQGGDALCGAPFVFLFVGYNGQYYLCCSDWKKEVPLGSVFDKSFRRHHAEAPARDESRVHLQDVQLGSAQPPHRGTARGQGRRIRPRQGRRPRRPTDRPQPHPERRDRRTRPTFRSSAPPRSGYPSPPSEHPASTSRRRARPRAVERTR